MNKLTQIEMAKTKGGGFVWLAFALGLALVCVVQYLSDKHGGY